MTKRNLFVERGQRFGKLTVVSEFDRYYKGHLIRVVNCVCDCGNKTETHLLSLYKKKYPTKSCGCEKGKYIRTGIENKTHGLSSDKIYRVWIDIKTRTTNQNSKNYKGYGQRGIGISDEWMVFENFYNWAMISGYNSSLQIERIDNNSGYNPENCKWATREEQNWNKRSNIIVIYNGKKYAAKEFALKYGLVYSRVLYKLKTGIINPIRLIDLCKP